MIIQNVIQPDALIRVRFLTPEEGGRKTPVIVTWTQGQQTGYGCPMRINGSLHDFRTLISKNTTYVPGKTYGLNIKFLCSETVLPKLHIGLEVELWEGKTIATGFVEKINVEGINNNENSNSE